MDLLRPIALIVAGIIAASGFIISRKPDAKQLLDKLVPFQGFLGVGLLAWGVIDLIRVLGNLKELSAASDVYPIYVICIYAAVVAEILLGFLLGFPLIAKWIPGESAAEQRAADVQKKIVPYQTLLGFVGMGVAVVLLYYYFKLPH
jgi:hypothetical protein